MNNKVKFLRGTSDEYTVAEKDSDTIYFTTDDGKLYIGDKEVSGDGSITIDNTLSDTSTNPVQNKVTKAAIDEKASKSLYGDTAINVGRKANTDVGNHSSATGLGTTASGTMSSAEGNQSVATGDYSHAEGSVAKAEGHGSHAEGYSTLSSGIFSHAENRMTTASGNCSHAEGNSSTASKDYAHAEGSETTADGVASHAEGSKTIASGAASHAEGIGTIASKTAESASGKYNLSNSDTLYSVGDGTSNEARHNAFEITTTGGKLHDKNISVEGHTHTCNDITDFPDTIENANKINGHTVESDVPADAVFKYELATTEHDGLMSSDDKSKINSINIAPMTREDYESISVKDPNTYYMITDDIGEYTDPIVLNVGEGREYTTLYAAIEKASQIMGQKVIINIYAGEYDIYNELGGDDFIKGINGRSWFEIAPVLSGDVEIHGIGNVVLKLDIPDDIYSTYPNDCRKVSIIGTNRNIFIENITFICSNCRYAIHDECDNNYYIDATNTKHVFKNLRVYATNASNCIGIGTVSGHFEIKDCYFSNVNTQGGCVFLHDWHKSIGGNLNISSCIFESDPGNEVTLSVASNSVFDVYLSNNNFEKLYIQRSFNEYTQNNFRIIGVNNTISSVTIDPELTNPYPVKLV